MEKQLEELQYPIGRFKLPTEVSADEIKSAIARIAAFPSHLLETVRTIPSQHLDNPYRPGGWTIRQVVHHCADSHMNAFIRFKLALTEESPVIKPYEEARWAEQPDYLMGTDISLLILGGVHRRWITLMESMSESDWDKSFIHPQYNRVQQLRQTVMLYAWHGEHHHAHIVNAGKGSK